MNKDFKNIKVKSDSLVESILLYLKTLQFIHKVSAPKDQRTLAIMINEYISLSKDVTKDELINTLLFSSKSTTAIKDEANMSKHEFSMFLKRMTEKKLIVENTLRKSIVPKVHNGVIGLTVIFE